MKKLIIFSILFIIAFSSCKKESCPAPPVYMNMAGTTWNGLVNVPGLGLSGKPLILIFNADGTLGGSLTNGAAFAIAGTWNLIPGSSLVRMFYTIVTVAGSYVGQATLNADNTKLESGTGTNATSPTANLNFTATKS